MREQKIFLKHISNQFYETHEAQQELMESGILKLLISASFFKIIVIKITGQRTSIKRYR